MKRIKAIAVFLSVALLCAFTAPAAGASAIAEGILGLFRIITETTDGAGLNYPTLDTLEYIQGIELLEALEKFGINDMTQGDFSKFIETNGLDGYIDEEALNRLVAYLNALGGEPVPAAVKGDVDGDGAVTAADARLALRMSVGLTPPSAAADVDGDGFLTAGDARQILRMAVNLSADGGDT